jgi:hypothetical protein
VVAAVAGLAEGAAGSAAQAGTNRTAARHEHTSVFIIDLIF